MAFDSLTNISEFNGCHYWTIRNWKSWVGCSEADATIFSDKFCIPITNSEGNEEETFWMIKAFPRKHNATGKDMLAFRLVSLNEKTPKGMFHFKTIGKPLLGCETSVSKFKPLPLDSAYHWMTCIRYHPSEALTIKVKIKIVTNQKTRPMEKKKSKARSFLNMLGHFLLNMDGAGPMQAYPRHIRYSRL